MEWKDHLKGFERMRDELRGCSTEPEGYAPGGAVRHKKRVGSRNAAQKLRDTQRINHLASQQQRQNNKKRINKISLKEVKKDDQSKELLLEDNYWPKIEEKSRDSFLLENPDVYSRGIAPNDIHLYRHRNPKEKNPIIMTTPRFLDRKIVSKSLDNDKGKIEEFYRPVSPHKQVGTLPINTPFLSFSGPKNPNLKEGAPDEIAYKEILGTQKYASYPLKKGTKSPQADHIHQGVGDYKYFSAGTGNSTKTTSGQNRRYTKGQQNSSEKGGYLAFAKKPEAMVAHNFQEDTGLNAVKQNFANADRHYAFELTTENPGIRLKDIVGMQKHKTVKEDYYNQNFDRQTNRITLSKMVDKKGEPHFFKRSFSKRLPANDRLIFNNGCPFSDKVRNPLSDVESMGVSDNEEME